MNSHSNLENSGITPATEIALPITDRRTGALQRKSPGFERRQFSDGYQNLSSEAAELGLAIDQYKLANGRRFISYEEMLTVIKSLGYAKQGIDPV